MCRSALCEYILLNLVIVITHIIAASERKKDPSPRYIFNYCYNNRTTSDIVPSREQFLTNLCAAVGSGPIKQFVALQQKLERHLGFRFLREDSHTMGYEK